jgi:hypothetical protein
MVGDAEWMFEYEGSLPLQVFHKQRLRIVDHRPATSPDNQGELSTGRSQEVRRKQMMISSTCNLDEPHVMICRPAAAFVLHPHERAVSADAAAIEVLQASLLSHTYFFSFFISLLFIHHLCYLLSTLHVSLASPTKTRSTARVHRHFTRTWHLPIVPSCQRSTPTSLLRPLPKYLATRHRK